MKRGWVVAVGGAVLAVLAFTTRPWAVSKIARSMSAAPCAPEVLLPQASMIRVLSPKAAPVAERPVLPMEEGWREMERWGAAETDPEEFGKWIGIVADDPELSRFMREKLGSWAKSSDSSTRAKALALRVRLESLDAGAWRDAVAGESDPAARAFAVALPPERADIAGAVLHFVEKDVDAGVRCAAVAALPSELGAIERARLAKVLRAERDGKAREAIVRTLWMARCADPAVVNALKALAIDPAEPTSLRRQGLAALVRISHAHPEALPAAELDEVRRTLPGSFD